MNNKIDKSDSRFGVVAALPTPLTADRTLDKEAYVRIINHAIDGGVNGVAPMGSSGEGANLSSKIWAEATAMAIQEVGDRVQVYCGAIHSSTAETIDCVYRLEEMGARIVLSTPHFYMNTSCQEEVLRHFHSLSEATSMDVVVYNIPMLTHVNIETETLVQLSEIPSIVACKDTAQDWVRHQEMLRALKGSGMEVLIGGEELVAASLLLGSKGVVAGYASLFPGLFVSLYEAANRGEIEVAKTIQGKILDLKKISSASKSWISGMKYAAHRLGLCSPFVGLPFEPINDLEKREIDKIIEPYV